MIFKKYSLTTSIAGILTVIVAVIGILLGSSAVKSKDLEKKLDMTGWNVWHDITVSKCKESNECIINSKGKIKDAAGFFNSNLDFLHGKTLILYFSNTAKSKFHNNHLVKLEYENGVIVRPSNNSVPLIGDGYLNATDKQIDKGIEFVMTDKFAGRLNFVFYKADLKDLKITAWYK